MNSFCALPRFLASLGSCEPPNTSRHDDKDDDLRGLLAGTDVHRRVALPRSRTDDASGNLGPLTADPPALTLGQSAPDAELLAVLKRELEAVLAHDTTTADLLGLSRRRPALREEEIGIDTETVGVVLPVLGLLDLTSCRRTWWGPSLPVAQRWLWERACDAVCSDGVHSRVITWMSLSHITSRARKAAFREAVSRTLAERSGRLRQGRRGPAVVPRSLGPRFSRRGDRVRADVCAR